MSPSKYRNKRVEFDGYKFDSRKEADRYIVLRELQKERRIAYLEVHPRFDLVVNLEKICFYRADFAYSKIKAPRGKQVVEDVKGYKKGGAWSVFRIKQKLMWALHGIRVEVV